MLPYNCILPCIVSYYLVLSFTLLQDGTMGACEKGSCGVRIHLSSTRRVDLWTAVLAILYRSHHSSLLSLPARHSLLITTRTLSKRNWLSSRFVELYFAFLFAICLHVTFSCHLNYIPHSTQIRGWLGTCWACEGFLLRCRLGDVQSSYPVNASCWRPFSR